MNNVLIVFDPQMVHVDELTRKVVALWPDADAVVPEGKFLEIPVVYGGESGIDLVDMAKRAELSVREYVKRHTSPEYTTFFVGGYPGQPHLGGLHPSLVTPRRSDPRMRVPKGTVAIGGEQTTVYPSTQPGGLQLIGFTEVEFFDINRTPPSLLAPGDRVKLRAVRIEV
jgi:KipI family sensor histidine kinase inhibitor